MRSYFEKLPDGRYVGRGVMDDDGISDEEIPFEVVLEIEGTTARLDFSNAPAARPGPVNCPIASTVSAARVIMTMLAGGGEAPNEGHFRPIEVDRAAGLDVRMRRSLAVLPLRLAGDAGDRGGAQRGRRGDAGGGLRVLRRRPLLLPCGTASARTRASSGPTAHRIRSGRAPRSTATDRARACTTSKRRRGSRRSRCGRRRTRG